MQSFWCSDGHNIHHHKCYLPLTIITTTIIIIAIILSSGRVVKHSAEKSSFLDKVPYAKAARQRAFYVGKTVRTSLFHSRDACLVGVRDRNV